MATTVLLVDDESELRFMIGSYLEFAGYHVLAAGDAEEAMRLAAGTTLGAVILDVNLPGAGSAKLLELLKQNHPATTIILYTGQQADEAAVKNLLAKGAHRYLAKDGSLEGLLAAVKEVCG